MEIRLLKQISHPPRLAGPVGETLQGNAGDALRLISDGYAEPASEARATAGKSKPPTGTNTAPIAVGDYADTKAATTNAGTGES